MVATHSQRRLISERCPAKRRLGRSRESCTSAFRKWFSLVALCNRFVVGDREPAFGGFSQIRPDFIERFALGKASRQGRNFRRVAALVIGGALRAALLVNLRDTSNS